MSPTPAPLPEWVPRRIARALGRGRLIKRSTSDSVSMHDRWRVREYDPGVSSKSRFRREAVSGASWWRDGRKWAWLGRLIDRKADRYRETVVDPDTGKVIHHVDEPLSEHRRG